MRWSSASRQWPGKTLHACATRLAWLLAKGHDIVPIPGTKRVKYVEENVAAVSIELTKAEVEELETTFTRDAAAGDRYNEAMGRLVDR